MSAEKAKNYVNGLFISEWDGKYGPYLSIGITDNFIEELLKIPKNERGVRAIFATRQKKDNRKYSAFVLSKKDNNKPVVGDSVDDLPF